MSVDRIDWTEKKQLECMKKQLCECNPNIDPDQEFVFINTLPWGDPQHDKELREGSQRHAS